MHLKTKVIRKSLFQEAKESRLCWRLFAVVFIKYIRIEFTGEFQGEAEVLLLEPAISKSTTLAKSGEGVVEWRAKDPFEDKMLVGRSTVELKFDGTGNCRAFVELEVEKQ